MQYSGTYKNAFAVIPVVSRTHNAKCTARQDQNLSLLVASHFNPSRRSFLSQQQKYSHLLSVENVPCMLISNFALFLLTLMRAKKSRVIFQANTKIFVSWQQILDGNDPPTDVEMSSTMVGASTAIGQSAAVLQCIDEDTEDTHTFRLVDDADGRFNVDGNQLEVFVERGLK